ncbi:MAG: hypothetical protein U0169_19060 [Polyangiaceae bacterium]
MMRGSGPRRRGNRSLQFLGTSLLWGALAACGPREPAASTTTLIFPGGALADRFHGRSPRLTVAREEIGRLLGHGLEIRIDAAFEPRWALATDEHVERIVVDFGREMKRIETRSPKLFEAYKDAIRTVVYEFSATATRVETKLDVDAKLLRIVVTQDETYGCARRNRGALDDARDAEYVRMFDGKEPDAIPRKNLADYTRWLRRNEFFDPKGRGRAIGEPGATQLARQVRAYPLLEEGEARSELRKHLLGRLRSVGEFHHEAFPPGTTVDPASPWAVLERTYGAWLARDAESFDPSDQKELVESLTRRDRLLELPGFDLPAFVFRKVDTWIALGKPKAHYADDPALRDLLDVVCPYWEADDGRIREHPSNCRDFWRAMRSDESRLTRVVTYLVSKHDGDVVQAIFPNLVDEGNNGRRSGAALVPLWKRFVSDDVAWAAATRVVGTTASAYDSDVLGETVRIIRTDPKKRGLAFFVVATSERERAVSRTKAERRTDFEKAYAQAISEEEFRAYFAHGTLGFRYAANLVPYLAPGFSRFAAFERPMAMLLDGDDTARKAKYVASLASALCSEGARQDLSRLHDALVATTKRVPKTEPELRTLISQTARPTCEELAGADAR